MKAIEYSAYEPLAEDEYSDLRESVFSKFPITYLPWHDENLLADIDTLEDYRRLLNGG